MSVLIEALSVVVRCDAIVARFPGGVEGFTSVVPNETLCADGELARVGFMTPQDTKAFVERLESRGLVYRRDGRAVDIVVVDQRSGMMVPCDWAEFGQTDWNGDPKCPVSACRARETRVEKLVVPKGWEYVKSLSARHRFVETGKLPPSVRFSRHQDGLDVYVDTDTGQEYFVGRTEESGPSVK
jgi:hypothetical protein